LFDSDHQINSYNLVRDMQFGLIYSSSIGLEIAHYGKSCLVAGKPFFFGKSFVISPTSKQDYFEKLSALCTGWRIIPDQSELNKLVYHIYFIRNNHLNGIDTITRAGGPVTTEKSFGDIQSKNKPFFDQFF